MNPGFPELTWSIYDLDFGLLGYSWSFNDPDFSFPDNYSRQLRVDILGDIWYIYGIFNSLNVPYITRFVRRYIPFLRSNGIPFCIRRQCYDS